MMARLIEAVEHPFGRKRIEMLRAAHQRAMRHSAAVGDTQSWYRMLKNHVDEGSTDVYIYDEIGLCGVEASTFVQDLNKIQTPRISVHMNTPGGEVFDGITIYNGLMNHPAIVTTVVDGLAASAGSFIMQAGEKRVVMPQSQIMIHDAAGLCVGNAADMRQLADLLDRLSNTVASVYAERAGGTVEDWRTRMLAESWYGAQEALDAGLATELGRPPAAGEPPADDVSMRSVWRALAFRYAGRETAPAPTPAPPVPVAELDPAVLRSAIRKAVKK